MALATAIEDALLPKDGRGHLASLHLIGSESEPLVAVADAAAGAASVYRLLQPKHGEQFRKLRARLGGEQPVDCSGEGGGSALRDSDDQPAVKGGAPHVSFDGFRIDADSKQPHEPTRSAYVAGIERSAAPSRR